MADLTIVTRGSLLARTQTDQMVRRLAAAHPGLSLAVTELSTTGDRRRDVPLPAIGGKGLFTQELEQALLSGAADLAVHSLKDLPVELPDGLTLGAVPGREEPRDALVLPQGAGQVGAEPLAALRAGACVGTSSTRRQAFLHHLRPDLSLEPVRGNLDTRLRKLDEGPFDALVLAAAGLHRLGWAARISALLPLEVCLPAPGQGALGLECRADDDRTLELLAALDDPAARAEVTAERAFLEALGGGCQTPCGACGRVEGEALVLTGAVADPDGTTVLRDVAVGPALEAAALGRGLASSLLSAGADRLLAGAPSGA